MVKMYVKLIMTNVLRNPMRYFIGSRTLSHNMWVHGVSVWLHWMLHCNCGKMVMPMKTNEWLKRTKKNIQMRWKFKKQNVESEENWNGKLRRELFATTCTKKHDYFVWTLFTVCSCIIVKYHIFKESLLAALLPCNVRHWEKNYFSQ